jgi:hypothetical protein
LFNVWWQAKSSRSASRLDSQGVSKDTNIRTLNEAPLLFNV